VQQSIAAISQGSDASAIKDFRLTGFMQISGSSLRNTIKVVSRGPDDMRLDIAMAEGGTHSVTFLGGQGKMRDRMGKETALSGSSRAGGEIAFLPTPAALSELLGSARAIEYVGSETVNGRPAHHIVVARQYSKNRDPLGVATAHSRTELFIDVHTSLVVKIASLVYEARGQKSSRRELILADYRAVNGLILPFSITEMLDGQVSWAITVESIELNPKLADKDFAL
jgi:hypothetical protein